MWSDIRHAARTLSSTPVFTTVAVLCVALGIGANTAIFSGVDAVLLRTLPVPNPEELVVVQSVGPRGGVTFSHPQFAYLRRHADAVAGLLAYARIDLNLSAGAVTDAPSGLLVSDTYFSTLGVQPAIGRPFAAPDEPAVLLNDRYWKTRFNSDPTVVGRAVTLNGVAVTIIGVTPPRFFQYRSFRRTAGSSGAAANQVVKFDTEGRVALVLGRKPETIGVRPNQPGAGRGGGGGAEGRGGAPGAAPGAAAAATPGAAAPAGAPAGAPGGAPAAQEGRGGGRGGPPGAGTPGSGFNRPTDVAWDRAGNIYVADGIGNNNRVAKFDKDGRFIKHWGSTGNGPGQFSGIKAIAIDAQGNVYAADFGNKRIQVFDSEGTFKSEFGNIGRPLAMCITRGATQHLYVSHAGDEDGMEDAAIYKVQLDGKVVGKFGSAGKLPKEFGLANSLDCRSDTELLVGEMTNWRVQRVTLKR